jgi:pyruvate/2-oxoglutarate dehydrogenase complex dihydrolipoamide acyltransferase (E2) component
MPDNSTDVKVGKLIALIVEKGDDWKNVEVPKIEASQKPSETKKPPTKEKEEQPKTDKQQQQQSEQSQYAFFHIKTKSFLIFIYSVMLSVQLHVHF